MRLLIVGDYHAEPSDLDDCRKLADLIVDVAKQHQAMVVFMGDQYHTHAIIHAEVQLFWIQLYAELHKHFINSISLVGNHDKPGSAHSKASAMLAHKVATHVVSEPVAISAGRRDLLFVPYYDDPEEFVKVCNSFPNAHTLFCHQTFNGASYDNGFYDKHGPDPNLIQQVQIISGHIHRPQEFSKVWYVGAPRWRTLSDANVDRAIWLVDFDSEGKIVKRTPFNTGDVCRQIRTVEDREVGGSTIPSTFDPRHEWRVDIYGTAAYIEDRSAFLKAQGCKVRTFRTELDQPLIKESEGIDKAFTKWVTDFQPQHGTDKAVLETMLKDRLKWQAA